jgi:hypothetical protein
LFVPKTVPLFKGKAFNNTTNSAIHQRLWVASMQMKRKKLDVKQVPSEKTITQQNLKFQMPDSFSSFNSSV